MRYCLEIAYSGRNVLIGGFLAHRQLAVTLKISRVDDWKIVGKNLRKFSDLVLTFQSTSLQRPKIEYPLKAIYQ